MANINADEIRKIKETTLIEIYKSTGRRFVPAAVSGRHVHLCRADIDALFGVGYELHPLKPLSQPGQYAASETISLVGPKGRIDKIRVLGPARKDTQLELSVTDTFKVGVKPVVRMSGEVAGSPGAFLEADGKRVELKAGIMVSARHIHISAEQARAMDLSDGQVVSLKTGGGRSIIMENVVVRSGDGHDLEVHIDTDEANAALVKNGDIMEILL